MSATTLKRFTLVSSALAALFALAPLPASAAGNPIVHRVSVGGPDACQALANSHPGCNANFSLVALQHADGSVTGNFIDRLEKDDGYHATVNCLVVDGHNAWVGGVIVQGKIGNTDLKGRPVVTRVQDNGTSARDPVDRISYSWIGDARPCTLKLNYQLLDAPQGQVKVQ
jgi:chemotaxis response regulator CheB